MAASESAVMTLKGGLTVSVDALRIGWALEARGFTIRPCGERLQVLPPERLTAADAAAIRRHRDELLALALYGPPEVA